VHYSVIGLALVTRTPQKLMALKGFNSAKTVQETPRNPNVLQRFNKLRNLSHQRAIKQGDGMADMAKRKHLSSNEHRNGGTLCKVLKTASKIIYESSINGTLIHLARVCLLIVASKHELLNT
jgi:hypothetical protein